MKFLHTRYSRRRRRRLEPVPCGAPYTPLHSLLLLLLLLRETEETAVETEEEEPGVSQEYLASPMI